MIINELGAFEQADGLTARADAKRGIFSRRHVLSREPDGVALWLSILPVHHGLLLGFLYTPLSPNQYQKTADNSHSGHSRSQQQRQALPLPRPIWQPDVSQDQVHAQDKTTEFQDDSV